MKHVELCGSSSDCRLNESKKIVRKFNGLLLIKLLTLLLVYLDVQSTKKRIRGYCEVGALSRGNEYQEQ